MTSGPKSRPTSNTSDGDAHQSPRKKSALKRLVGLVALTAVFGSVFVAATTAPSAADWKGECYRGVCSNGEKDELFKDFHSECYEEVCYTEEVGEIAGVEVGPGDRYDDITTVARMFQWFEYRAESGFVGVEYDVYEEVKIQPDRFR